jgi:hypothetical protein
MGASRRAELARLLFDDVENLVPNEEQRSKLRSTMESIRMDERMLDARLLLAVV